MYLFLLYIGCIDDEWCESWRLTASDFEDNHEGGRNLVDKDSMINDDIVVESQLRRRQKFCNRIEGYGEVCSCAHPAPLDFHPIPVIIYIFNLNIFTYLTVHLIIHFKSMLLSNLINFSLSLLSKLIFI